MNIHESNICSTNAVSSDLVTNSKDKKSSSDHGSYKVVNNVNASSERPKQIDIAIY